MNKAELITSVAEKTGMTKKNVEEFSMKNIGLKRDQQKSALHGFQRPCCTHPL